MAGAWESIFASGNPAAGLVSGIDAVGKSWADQRERQAGEELLRRALEGQQSLASLGRVQQSQPVNGQPLSSLGMQGAVNAAPSAAFPSSLVKTESGGNWQAQNNERGAGGAMGHFGRLQFGQARLQEAAQAGAIPQGTTPQAFMASPELQQRAEQWHFSDIDNFIKQRGLDSAVGQKINGTPVTVDGMRAVAHLGGKGGLEKFITSGGEYNPADANGTSLMSYFAQHGGGQARANPLANTAPMAQQPMQVAQAQIPQQQMDPQLLSQMMGNRFTAPLAQQMLLKNLGRDPMQQQIQAEQLRAAQLGNQRAEAEMRGEGAKLNQIDLGDSIGFVNQRGEVVRSIPKNVRQQPVALNEGQTLVNPATGQTVASAQPKATEFQKTLDKKNADMFSTLLDQGTQTQSDLADIGTLKELLPKTPSGVMATGARALNKVGLGGENGANVQQFDAIINRLVPAQRPAGSGTMSDRDVELFKSSLPNLAGSEKGNTRIIQTMEGMARYKQTQVEIANRVATGQMTPVDGLKALNSIPNPLAWVRSQPPAGKTSPQTSSPGAITDGATATNPQTGQRIRFTNGQWVPVQ